MTEQQTNAPDGTSDEKEVSGQLQISSLDGKVDYVEKISQQFNNSKFSDIALVVGEKRYPAHKLILATLSPYFERMFYGGTWKENSGGDIKLEESENCADVFETFLSYFYSGSISVTKKTVIPIVTLADKYDVCGLKDICTSYMLEMLYIQYDFMAALCWVTFAERMRMHNLQGKCYDLICFNFEKACNLNGWKSLSLKQVLAVLTRSDVVVSNEYVVFQAVDMWLTDNTITEEEISHLVSHVQFKNMTVEQMCQVEKSGLESKYANRSDSPLSPYLNDAFRFVAVKNFYPKGEIEPASFQRLYTADPSTKLSTVTFNSKSLFAGLKPVCSWSSEPARYHWEFGQFDDSEKYQIRLPKVSRVESYCRHYLFMALPDTYCFKVSFIFRNKAGHVICAITSSFNAQIPKADGEVLAEFPESSNVCKSSEDPESIAYDVMYYFVIEKT